MMKFFVNKEDKFVRRHNIWIGIEEELVIRVVSNWRRVSSLMVILYRVYFWYTLGIPKVTSFIKILVRFYNLLPFIT